MVIIDIIIIIMVIIMITVIVIITVIINVIIMNTRPKPAYSWQGLDWIVWPEYSFAVFSTSRFAPASVDFFDGAGWGAGRE